MREELEIGVIIESGRTLYRLKEKEGRPT